ncbi:hypothetical protein LY78DRAFT_256812 [Colletotrichum sublineola]|nr:hypothetical protein LY78DRAFT_256812 [Colletotrichum sublineola]
MQAAGTLCLKAMRFAAAAAALLDSCASHMSGVKTASVMVSRYLRRSTAAASVCPRRGLPLNLSNDQGHGHEPKPRSGNADRVSPSPLTCRRHPLRFLVA